MIERLDARVARWPRPLRWLYLGVKWYLVCLGAYLVIGNYVLKWGPWAAAWFLVAPLIYGLLRGLSGESE